MQCRYEGKFLIPLFCYSIFQVLLCPGETILPQTTVKIHMKIPNSEYFLNYTSNHMLRNNLPTYQYIMMPTLNSYS